mgnify:CR=1 FL=1
MLIHLFLEKAHQAVSMMASLTAKGDNEGWRNFALDLQGVATKMGASQLGQLCGEASEKYLAPNDEKAAMLNGIYTELMQLKTGFRA